MKGFEPLEKAIVTARKVTVGALFLGALLGCSDAQPQNDDGLQIYPTITASNQPQGVQCRAEEVRREGNSVVYRSIYFVIDGTGTETVQSQVEGSRPCP